MEELTKERAVLDFFESLSNWGRWGENDELGTLNLVSAENRRRAAALVRDGIVVSCGHGITPRSSRPGEPILHLMMSTGDDAPADGLGSTTDWLGIGWHGTAVTHLDSHAHILWRRQMYGGRDASRVTARHGAASGAIDVAGDGIVSRGVLIDLPRHRGERVPVGEAVHAKELDACVDAQGISIESGDLVLVRFGRVETKGARHDAVPGLDPDCLPWLHQHDVALLGTDYVSDPLPSRYPRIEMPVHAVGIVAMGLWILDNAALDEVSSHCERLGRWEFLFCVSPLRISRATGSPVNPLAIL